MLRFLMMLAAFVLGWIASAVVPPPGFVYRKVDRLLNSTEKLIDEKISESKKSVERKLK